MGTCDIVARLHVCRVGFQAAQGRVGILLDKDPTQPLPAGRKRLVTIDFEIVQSETPSALIAFVNTPIRSEVINGLTQRLPADFTDTVVSLVAPTSAPVDLTGRVTTENGNGVSNVVITVIGQNGETRRVTTNGFGIYTVTNIAAGRTYVVAATHRSYRFDPPNRVVTLDDNVAGIDFRAIR